MKKIITALLLLAAAGAHAESQPVLVEAIDSAPIEYRVRTYGVLAPDMEEISSEIAGRIIEFSAEEGDRVDGGAVLFRLDTETLRKNLRAREAELDVARRSLDRMTVLSRDGSIQQSQLEQAQAQFVLAETAVEQIRESIDNATVIAPSNGVILAQYVDSKTNVQAGQPVFLFQSDDEDWITKVELTDRNVLAMEQGAQVEAVFSAFPGQVFRGELVKLARIANTSNGLFTAELAIDPGGAALRPGMVAEVDLISESGREYFVVPFSALVNVRDRSGVVFALEPGASRVREVPVVLVHTDRDRAFVDADLSGFDRVVSRGHQSLRDQDQVTAD